MFLKNRRNCKCNCLTLYEDWDICFCDCECKGHRKNIPPTNEEIEKRNKFIKKAKEKKLKQELSNLEDDLIF